MLKKEAPSMSISSYSVDRDTAERELAAGQLDFAIDALFVFPGNICYLPLISQPYVCVARAEAQGDRKRMTLTRYLEAEHIHVSSRRFGSGHIDAALDSLGHKRVIGLRVQHYLIAASVTEQTELLWSLPKALAETYPLHMTELPFEAEPMQCYLQRHKNAHQDPANIWMREKLVELSSASTLIQA